MDYFRHIHWFRNQSDFFRLNPSTGLDLWERTLWRDHALAAPGRARLGRIECRGAGHSRKRGLLSFINKRRSSQPKGIPAGVKSIRVTIYGDEYGRLAIIPAQVACGEGDRIAIDGIIDRAIRGDCPAATGGIAILGPFHESIEGFTPFLSFRSPGADPFSDQG